MNRRTVDCWQNLARTENQPRKSILRPFRGAKNSGQIAFRYPGSSDTCVRVVCGRDPGIAYRAFCGCCVRSQGICVRVLLAAGCVPSLLRVLRAFARNTCASVAQTMLDGCVDDLVPGPAGRGGGPLRPPSGCPGERAHFRILISPTLMIISATQRHRTKHTPDVPNRDLT